MGTTAARDAIGPAIASGEPWRILEAARAWARDVRASQVGGAELAETLAPLAGHASADVRKEVAEALDLFPLDVFDALVTPLADDPNHYVANAAKRAAKRRAAKREERVRRDEDIEAMGALFRELEDTYDLQARKTAERLVRRGRELFTRRLFHELSKAYGGIDLALALMARELDAPSIDRAALRRYADEALARSRHVASIAERALATTATGTGTGKRAFDEESLALLVEEARVQLVERLGARAAQVAFEADVDPEITLDADRGALLQALANVFQNAVEAYPEGTATLPIGVRAGWLRARSQVEITVTDRGKGMDDAALAALFVPFASVKPGGTGVGMSTLQRMIEDVHGGALTVASRPGDGTRVRMILPREQRS